VRINAAGYSDKAYVDEVLQKGKLIQQSAIEKEQEIIKLVNEKIGI
jgi:glutamate formiminotransferase/formiminotetrahydrofolate cyclodeaminase